MKYSRNKIIVTTIFISLLIVFPLFLDRPVTARAQESAYDLPGGTTDGLAPAGSADTPADTATNDSWNPVDWAVSGVGQSILASLSSYIKEGLAWIAYIFLWLSSLFLAIVGWLFDYVMTYTVVQMKTNYTGFQVINTGWADVRDIGNLVFVFMAIYLGITTIIGRASGQIKKLVTNLIIVALLVNFSLFFTQLLVDASNVLTISFYNLMALNWGGTPTSLSTVFMKPLGIQSIFSSISAGITAGTNAASNTNAAGATSVGVGTAILDQLSNATSTAAALANLGYGQILAVGFGGTIFIIITAVTLIITALLFVIRFVVILFLMILSPLAFLFAVIPGKLNGIAQKWWETLAGQLIFAPLYMILIFIVAALLNNNAGSLTVGASSGAPATLATAITSPGVGSIGTIFFFVLIIFLMNAAMYFSLQWAMAGSGLVSKVVSKTSGAVSKGFSGSVKWVGSKAGETAAAAGGKIGRATVGRVADALGNSEKLKRGTLSTNVVTRTAARFTSGQLNKAATASFDIRATSLGKNISEKSGFQFGEAQGKGGYREKLEEDAKNHIKEVTKTYKGGASAETTKKLYASRAAVAKAQDDLVRVTAISTTEDEEAKLRAQAALVKANSLSAANEKEIKDKNDAIKTAQDTIKAADDKIKYRKDSIKAAQDAIQAAGNETKKLERAQKTEQQQQQAAYLVSKAKWFGTQTKRGKVLGAFGSTHAASHDKALEEFSKQIGKKPSTDEEKKEAAEYKKIEFKDAIKSKDFAKIQELSKDMKPEMVEELSEEITKDEGVLGAISPQAIKIMLGSKKLTAGQREKIGDWEKKTRAGNNPPQPAVKPPVQTPPVQPSIVKVPPVQKESGPGGEYDLKSTTQTSPTAPSTENRPPSENHLG